MKNTRTWRRVAAVAVTGAGLAAGAVVGPAPIAAADVIGDLACEFGTAPGSGNVSGLLNQSVALSAQGFRPSPANLAAITDSLRYRPNQVPLIEALTSAVDGQQNTRTLAAAASAGMGPTSTFQVNQAPTGGISNPYQINGLGEDAFDNRVVLGAGEISLGGQNYTIGNGGELVVPVGC